MRYGSWLRGAKAVCADDVKQGCDVLIADTSTLGNHTLTRGDVDSLRRFVRSTHKLRSMLAHANKINEMWMGYFETVEGVIEECRVHCDYLDSTINMLEHLVDEKQQQIRPSKRRRPKELKMLRQYRRRKLRLLESLTLTRREYVSFEKEGNISETDMDLASLAISYAQDDRKVGVITRDRDIADALYYLLETEYRGVVSEIEPNIALLYSNPDNLDTLFALRVKEYKFYNVEHTTNILRNLELARTIHVE